MKKLVSVVMSVVLAIGLMPLPAYAQEGDLAAGVVDLSAPVEGDADQPQADASDDVAKPAPDGLYADDPSADMQAQAVGETGTYEDEASGFKFYYKVTSEDKAADGTVKGGTVALTNMYPMDGAFTGKDSYKDYYGTVDVTLPSKIGIYTVDELSEEFSAHDYLRSVTIPASITKLKGSAEHGGFGYAHENLTSVTFASGSKVTEIPDYFFYGNGLTSITLPDGVTSIGAHAFDHCLNLKSVTWPKNLTAIGDYAFNCTSLSSLSLPSKLKTIGDCAFSKEYSSADWAPDYTMRLQFTSITIPDSVTAIGTFAFSVGDNMGDGLDSKDAFMDDNERPYYMGLNSIKTIKLGKNLKTIGKGAFAGSAITTIQIPATVTSIGEAAFSCSWYLKSVTFSDFDNAKLQEMNGFEHCRSLTSVQVPVSVTSIGANAFQYDVSLESITLPPSVQTIGGSAFAYAGLKNPTMPSGLRTIGELAFVMCGLQSITLNEGLVTIGGRAFWGCASLAKIEIPATVTTIGASAFEQSGIKSVSIVDGSAPLTIGDGAFMSCTGLNGTTIELPRRVAKLESAAFLYLEGVTYRIYNPSIAIDTEGSGISGLLTEADLGPYYDPETMKYDIDYYLDHKDDEGYTDRYSFSMSDPWSSDSYDVYQKLKNHCGDSVVYYPDTLTSKTSPSFWAYVKLVDYGCWGSVYRPEFKTFDAGESGDPDPVIEEDVFKGKLQVTTSGDGGGDANICVFDSAGVLVATEQASQGYTVIDYLQPGTYTVIAFANNAHFSTISAEADFSAMGLTSKDYAKATATIKDDAAAELTLVVPAIKTTNITNLLADGDVLVAKKSVPKNVELFATVKYEMASGKKADKLVVSVPAGLQVTSAASVNKDYGTSGFNARTHQLTLTLDSKDKTSGRIWVGLKATAVGAYSVNASIASGSSLAPVGSAPFNCDGVVLDLPVDIIDGNSFPATVHAEPGVTVQLRTGDATFNFGPTNAAGTYSGTVELGDYGALGVTSMGVTASVQDGDRVYSDYGTVSMRFVNQYDLQLQEFYFIYNHDRHFLVKNGERQRAYYVYNGREENERWTFRATYVSPTELTGVPTLQVEMMDGSSRYQEMSLLKQERQADGTYLATFATSMRIEALGDHVFDDSSIIPCGFDVLYDYDVESSTAMTQEVVDWLKNKAFVNSDAWKLECRRKAESFGMSMEPLEAVDDGSWNLFHSFREDPDMMAIYNALPAEYQQMMDDVDAAMVHGAEGMEYLCGFTVPARECNDMQEYIQRNLGMKTGQSFDAKKLASLGFDVITDGNAGGSTGVGTPTADGSLAVPAQYATKLVYDGDMSASGMGALSDEDASAMTAMAGETKGKPKGATYRDSNGNGATVQFAEWTRDYDPVANAQGGWDMDRTSIEIGTAGQSTEQLFNYVASNKNPLKLTDSQVLKVGHTLENAGAVTSGVGLFFDCYKYEEQGKGLADSYARYQDMKGQRENLEMRYHYFHDIRADDLKEWAKNGQWEEYVERTRCTSALLFQMFAARKLEENAWIEAAVSSAGISIGAFFTAVSAISDVTGHAEISAASYVGSTMTTLILDKIGLDNAKEYVKNLQEFNKYSKEIAENCDGNKRARHPVDTCLDPSGTVYEAVPDNVLAGVTATVYNTGVGEAWDAAAYGQVNPQVTAADGVFAWDVTSGTWQVKFTKSGYNDAQTDELTVPPPRVGLTVGMVSKAAPIVESVTVGTDYVEVIFSQYMDTSGATSVSVGGKKVDAKNLTWVDSQEAGDGSGKKLSRVLHVPVPSGTKEGAKVKVNVADAVNYAGTHMGAADERTVTATVRPAEIRMNFEDTISLPVGTARPTTVRVYDSKGNPVKGVTLKASLDDEYLATVSDEGAVTDADGAAKLPLEALLPGLCTLTVSVEDTTLTRQVDLLTTMDSNQAARPTATLGKEVIGEGAPAENAFTVAKGTKLTLACATEGATIFYTTDGSCPCQNTPGRKVYNGAITINANTNLIIASYKDGMDYSEKLRLNVTVDDETATVPMYRLYNPNSGEHFYTGDSKERDNVIKAGWNDEQIGWYAPASDKSVPVYRVYNAYGGEHHYTTDASEKDMLVKAGWNYEGIGWYSDPAKTVALLREYNPNQFACNHNYTTDKSEHDFLVSIGWKDEGYAWYAVKAGK